MQHLKFSLWDNTKVQRAVKKSIRKQYKDEF